MEDVGDGSVGDVDDSERPVGEIGGVLLAIGETSSVWKSASWPCLSDVTYGKSSKLNKDNDIDSPLFNDL